MPTDLPPNRELFPQHGQDEILPATGCQTLPQENNSLATIFICIIPQIGLVPPLKNSYLEEGTVTCQSAGSYHVAVKPPGQEVSKASTWLLFCSKFCERVGWPGVLLKYQKV